MSNRAPRLTMSRYSPRTLGRGTSLSLIALCVIVVACVVAPHLAPDPPTSMDLLQINAGMSASHWLGTDELGRDILSRILNGTPSSLAGPLAVVAVAGLLGISLALSAAWLGGVYGRLVASAFDLMFSIPPLLVAIVGVAFVGPGQLAPVAALSIAYSPYIGRVVSSVGLRERALPYVESLELSGVGGLRICLRHILPNISNVVRAQACISFGAAMVDLSAIAFLGLGPQPPSTTWGLMVADGESALLNGQPLACLAPLSLIIVVILAANLLGSRLQSEQKVGL